MGPCRLRAFFCSFRVRRFFFVYPVSQSTAPPAKSPPRHKFQNQHSKYLFIHFFALKKIHKQIKITFLSYAKLRFRKIELKFGHFENLHALHLKTLILFLIETAM